MLFHFDIWSAVSVSGLDNGENLIKSCFRHGLKHRRKVAVTFFISQMWHFFPLQFKMFSRNPKFFFPRYVHTVRYKLTILRKKVRFVREICNCKNNNCDISRNNLLHFFNTWQGEKKYSESLYISILRKKVNKMKSLNCEIKSHHVGIYIRVCIY